MNPSSDYILMALDLDLWPWKLKLMTSYTFVRASNTV